MAIERVKISPKLFRAVSEELFRTLNWECVGINICKELQ